MSWPHDSTTLLRLPSTPAHIPGTATPSFLLPPPTPQEEALFCSREVLPYKPRQHLLHTPWPWQGPFPQPKFRPGRRPHSGLKHFPTKKAGTSFVPALSKAWPRAAPHGAARPRLLHSVLPVSAVSADRQRKGLLQTPGRKTAEAHALQARLPKATSQAWAACAPSGVSSTFFRCSTTC